MTFFYMHEKGTRTFALWAFARFERRSVLVARNKRERPMRTKSVKTSRDERGSKSVDCVFFLGLKKPCVRY